MYKFISRKEFFSVYYILQMSILLVFLGGGIGSIGRFGVVRFTKFLFGYQFPLGILAVNLLGCFLVGFLAAKFGKIIVDDDLRDFFIVGMLGGFTTFASFGLDTMLLFREHPLLAVLNVALNVCLGLLLVWAGFAVGRG